jgi:hypothetical protein
VSLLEPSSHRLYHGFLALLMVQPQLRVELWLRQVELQELGKGTSQPQVNQCEALRSSLGGALLARSILWPALSEGK